ncbi:MAG TPA: T9SS type A sorting domain-containing protein [Chitinophagaceae bacterium]|nr:T9SS type A sorting domain-containing protein [Chitinophagaceae bacterium]
MKQFIGILLFTCANAIAFAQVNFVKNPSFEEYSKCPDYNGNIKFCRYWSNAVDTDGIDRVIAPEHYTAACTPPDTRFEIPLSTRFYQYPHTGNAMVGAGLYYDRTPPPPGGLFETWRDYFQGRFHKPLEAGKTYCVSFWINLAEASGYAHDKIGAYVDNGGINYRDTPGNEILDVTPQIFTTKVVDDTMYWQKIEGSFVATGNETHITVGNFFPNTDIIAIGNTWGFFDKYSYYLFDDVSVIPIDLEADAGKDSHAEPGKSVQIGRVGDTTAQGLDCKWYYKGALIDSGAVISVKGSAIVGTVDTYVVVQTICGLSKSDTVTVKTVPLGMKEWNTNNMFSVFPNPSNGVLTITSTAVIPQGSVRATVYDLLGRSVYKQTVLFNNGSAGINVNTVPGMYILELADEDGNAARQRIVIE